MSFLLVLSSGGSNKMLAYFVSLDYVTQMKRMSSLSHEAVIKYQSTFKSVYLCPDTYQSAAVAVGSCLNIVDHVMMGKAS